MIRLNRIIGAVGIVCYMSASSSAELSDDMVVTGSVPESCIVSAPATMDFGVMEPGATKVVADQIKVTCTTGKGYTIWPHGYTEIAYTGTFNGEPFHNSYTPTHSTLVTAHGTLSFYKDAAASVVWRHNSTNITGVGNGAEQAIDISYKFVSNGAPGDFSFTLTPVIGF